MALAHILVFSPQKNSTRTAKWDNSACDLILTVVMCDVRTAMAVVKARVGLKIRVSFVGLGPASDRATALISEPQYKITHV